MNKPDSSSGPREVVSQALEASSTGCEGVTPAPEMSPRSSTTSVSLGQRADTGCTAIPAKGDISPFLTYRVLYLSLLKFATFLRIKIVYDDRTRTDKGCITFASYDEGKSAYDSVPAFSYAQHKTKANLMISTNLTDDDDDYYPNLFAELTAATVLQFRQELPPPWFVAFYKGS